MKSIEWEVQAYGAPKADILESITDSVTFKLSGPGMVAASYLSDAQEVLEFSPDTARSRINVSGAFILFISVRANNCSVVR
jgi:hypothetical protein